ncbi:MAG: T9SS type A sorting domain-containing protein [Bacteroidetes bacterium]|nr:T9SS type A sorting domain-containing protein [Bacteroidota bacterium]
MKNYSQKIIDFTIFTHKFVRIRSSRALIALMMLFIVSFSEAQTLLSEPQRAVFDAKRNRILVSNYVTGDLVEIDSAGNQTYFAKGADCVDGLEIVGDTIYGSGDHRNIRAYNLETKQLVMDIRMPSMLPGDDYLSSITSDSSGHLFISSPGVNIIYKMRISDQSYWVFAQDNGLTRPNGMLLEKEKNRIVVIDDSPNSIIHAISLADSTVSELMTTSFSSPDGIVRDKDGTYYVGGYYLDGIYKIDSAFSLPPTLFYAGRTFVYPTYIASDHSLLLTIYGANSWVRIPLQIFDFVADSQTGHTPLTVQFNEIFEALHPVTSWNWDFENDGVFDSNLPNPTHEYTQIGSYTVKLQVTMDNKIHSIIKENFINTFGGTSSIRFNGANDYAIIPAIPSYNLTDNFTIEMVVKPEDWGSRIYGSTIFDKLGIKISVVGFMVGPTGDYSVMVELKLQDGTRVKLSAPSNTIELGTWQHVAVSYNSTLSQLKIFINGTEQTVSVIGTNQPYGLLYNNDTTNISLGNDTKFLGDYKGSLDELKLWNLIRTNSEIAENIKNSLTGDEDGLIGYWQMDEGKGLEFADFTAIGNNGKMESAMFAEGVDLSLLTVSNEEKYLDNLPKEFCLEQNYPNPFNPSTIIKYNLKFQSDVKIIVSNILGETVKILVDGFQNAGTYKYLFNADNLSSGIYYYQIIAGNYIETKKMVLIR